MLSCLLVFMVFSCGGLLVVACLLLFVFTFVCFVVIRVCFFCYLGFDDVVGSVNGVV